jgi:hypothetical protein
MGGAAGSRSRCIASELARSPIDRLQASTKLPQDITTHLSTASRSCKRVPYVQMMGVVFLTGEYTKPAGVAPGFGPFWTELAYLAAPARGGRSYLHWRRTGPLKLITESQTQRGVECRILSRRGEGMSLARSLARVCANFSSGRRVERLLGDRCEVGGCIRASVLATSLASLWIGSSSIG